MIKKKGTPGNISGKGERKGIKPSPVKAKSSALVKRGGIPTTTDSNSASGIIENPQGSDDGRRKRPDASMNIVGHLEEFRKRFVVSLVFIMVITLVSFFFSDQLLYIINRPYVSTGLKLNVFNLIDGFLLRLKASLIAGLLIGFPVIIYEIWRYIAPAVDIHERRFARAAVIIAVFLFYLGITLTYLSLPMAIGALLSFTPPGMTSMINASDYLSLVMIFCLSIGVIFELPIVILILTKMGIVTPSFLVSKRKYAVVIIWIAAAVITPTVDPLSLSLVAIPLMLLYEISIIISKVVILRKKRRQPL